MQGPSLRTLALACGLLLLAPGLPAAAKKAAKARAGTRPAAASPDAGAPEGARLLVLRPAVDLPDDYDSVLKKASKAKASLVVLPLRRKGDNHEGAFELAELAAKSGLFSKVSVGDDLGRADYAVTGNWRSWVRQAGPGTAASSTTGLARWSYSGCEVNLDLLFEGEAFDRLAIPAAEAELYLNPPFTPLQLAQASHTGLKQAYQLALYKMAKDILKRSGR